VRAILGLMTLILGASIFLRAPSAVIIGEAVVFVSLMIVRVYQMSHGRTGIWRETGRTAPTPCTCRGKDAALRGAPGYKGPLQASGHRRDCRKLKKPKYGVFPRGR
jgi:hypothetical protein